MAPASGIGLLSGMGFVSGDSLWLRACGSASGVFAESIVKAGTRDSFGILQLSGRLGEKRKHCKVSVKRLDARMQEGDCFPFVSRVCL